AGDRRGSSGGAPGDGPALRRPDRRGLRQHRKDPGGAAEGPRREGPAAVARAVRPVHRRVRLSTAAPPKPVEVELAKGTRLVARRDPAMARLIKRVGKLELRDPHDDPFAALVRWIMFQLRRMDVWPVDDYGVRKGWALTHRLKEPPAPRALQAEGELFRPYRSVAAWYCWRAVDAAAPV